MGGDRETRDDVPAAGAPRRLKPRAAAADTRHVDRWVAAARGVRPTRLRGSLAVTGGRHLRVSVVLAAAAICGALALGAASAGTTDDVRSDADWILTAQLPDGAIAHYVDKQAVWPYLANFAASGLARATKTTGDRRYADAAWSWLSWYQAHQDANGYVTDYTIAEGLTTSTGDMDSTDAYAGTFLVAARDAWKVTGDKTRLAGLRAGVAAAVRAIESTQDADGLTWAKPTWRVKYAMDQAETYAGLRAAVDLAKALGDSALSSRASSDASKLKSGFAKLWNSTTGAYDWALHENGARQTTNWNVFYPDALQQVWPVAFGLVTGSRATALVNRFALEQPLWDQPAATALFSGGLEPVGYWPVAGWAFDRVGQSARAQQAAANIRAGALAASRLWPFTTATAGQLIVLAGGGPS